MKWFQKKSNSNNQNPLLSKLESIISDNDLLKNYSEVFYLGGGLYDENNLLKAKNAINAGQLSIFLADNPYDTQKDNIEFFFLKNEQGNFIVITSDPLELWDKEKIIDIIRMQDFDVNSIDNSEKLFPK